MIVLIHILNSFTHLQAGSHTEYSQPTRLESMMQDYPKLLHTLKHILQVDTSHLVITYPRSMAWSPVKNSLERGREMEEKTGHAESAASGERDLLELYKMMMTSVNTCPVCNPTHEMRVVVEDGAYVVFWPEAGATTEEIHHHVGGNVVIKSGSVVIVKTRNWYLENVTVKGTLILEDENPTAEEQGTIKLCNCQISNQGWKYIPIDCFNEDVSSSFTIRGYAVERKGECRLCCKKGEDIIKCGECLRS